MRAELASTFRTALHSAFPAISVEPVVVATNQARHGDYQCNNAMQLFGRMKGKVRWIVIALPPCQGECPACSIRMQHLCGCPRRLLASVWR